MYLKKIEKNIYNDKSGSGSTTHVSVIDSNNNSASITTSNGAGSGYIYPYTGNMMKNMLGEEDLNPEGFHSWNTSIRMQTMMSPTIISGNSVPELILGSGGREHAFAWKISKSSLCKKLLIAPGNAGTSELGTNVDIGVNDFESI